ncbi:MAG: macro domain-containing protein, partial [Gaiellaceae bacterium]
PIWKGGGDGEAALLASCHRRAIELAAELGCKSVAFPAISTGAYGYPLELAAPIAVTATQDALAANPTVELARFVFRDAASLTPYQAAKSAP